MSGLIAAGALAFVTACAAAPDDAADTERSPKASAERSSGAPSAPKASADLLRAAGEGDTDAVRAALRAGADTEVRDGEGRTPLLLAALDDHVAAAKALVAADADPDAQDEQDDSAWLVTGVTGSAAMARALVPADPDYSLVNRYGGTSLIPAGEHGHAAYVREVLRSTDMDVDHVNDLGWTALLEAVVLGDGARDHQRVVGLLLDGGADPELADRDGVTPLDHAERRGYDEIAELLREAGA
ncbi:ankyrin repeat domain-containing protein [Streptomyces sp. BH097]|uniref:ankyrin repeat domain-containing protein n=1 Tax=unclassified Streptomyces TaxID=2593676 RepID=UPI003BB6A0F7